MTASLDAAQLPEGWKLNGRWKELLSAAIAQATGKKFSAVHIRKVIIMRFQNCACVVMKGIRPRWVSLRVFASMCMEVEQKYLFDLIDQLPEDPKALYTRDSYKFCARVYVAEKRGHNWWKNVSVYTPRCPQTLKALELRMKEIFSGCAVSPVKTGNRPLLSEV